MINLHVYERGQKLNKMRISVSRFTVGATADEVALRLDEKVKYQLKDGTIIDAIIKSEVMSHSECPNLGYEAITLDDNQLTFIDGKRIVWWDGKMNTEEELNSAMAKAGTS